MLPLLKEIEVAKRLGCSCSEVKRLRKAGKLPYLPGRPVLIEESDLQAFIEREAADREAAKAAKATVKVKETPHQMAYRIWSLRQLHRKIAERPHKK